ncbi:MAG TPA: hypothetical protein VG297_23440 [Bryobacteraceae bacterium]|jgi:hypothetical protein|nr:hypothetical protein [Bryobacteraceae bacterium]
MRRLAIVFVVLAAVNTIEHVAAAGPFPAWRGVCQAPRRLSRALISIGEWKKFLIGRLRLTASSLSSRLIGDIN